MVVGSLHAVECERLDALTAAARGEARRRALVEPVMRHLRETEIHDVDAGEFAWETEVLCVARANA